MDKQTTIAFVLIGIVLVVWLYMTAPEPVVEKPNQTDSTTVVIDTVKTNTEKKPVVEEQKPSENIPVKEKEIVPPKEEHIITVENDLFIVELSDLGGSIHKIFLKEFNNWYSIKDKQ